MASQIPITFRLAPLPLNYIGSPQQLATDIVARLSAVSSNTISFFASGSVAPTSNVGPWLKNNTTWYVWSDTLATYVPEIIEFKSLRYIASIAQPSGVDYTLWIRLDGSGNPLGISYFNDPTWVDIYGTAISTAITAALASYSTTTQMDAAIQTAIDGQAKYAFSAKNSIDQSVTAGAGPTLVNFPVEIYDTGSRYSPSKFVAPAAGIYNFKAGILIGVDSGSPTDISIVLNITVNGNGVAADTNESDSETSGQNYAVDRDLLLAEGDEVEVSVTIDTTGASSWGIGSDSRYSFFQGSLVELI